MSDSDQLNRFEKWLKEKFSEWMPSYSQGEMEEDWSQLQEMMTQTAPSSGNKTFLPGGFSVWLPVIGVLILSGLGYIFYPYTINQEDISHDEAPVEQEQVETEKAINNEPLARFIPDIYKEHDFSEAPASLKQPVPVEMDDEKESLQPHYSSNEKEETDQDSEEEEREKKSGQDKSYLSKEEEQDEKSPYGPYSQPSSSLSETGQLEERETHDDYGGAAYEQNTESTEQLSDSIYCNYQFDGGYYDEDSKEPGEHELLARIDTNNGDIDSVFRTLIVSEPVKAQFAIEERESPEIKIRNASFGADEFFWKFGDGEEIYAYEPQHRYNDTGRYEVTLIAQNELGCKDTAKEQVAIYAEPEISEVPNVFTPDGSGINDEFFVDIEGYRKFELKIYNREGRLVYETRDSDDSWKGDCPDGDKCPSGTYFYRLEYQWLGEEANKQTKQGEVNLLR